MLYKFKSKAAGDVIMMGPAGDAVLRLLGRDSEPTGIFEAADLPNLIATLETAVQADDDARARAEAEAAAEGTKLAPREGVTLRQRAWPLVEMMKRAHAANVEIVWGV